MFRPCRAEVEGPDFSGFENATSPCLIQQEDGLRLPSGACSPEGNSFDPSGALFWDLVHPTEAAHHIVAIAAHSTLVVLQTRAPQLPGLASAR